MHSAFQNDTTRQLHRTPGLSQLQGPAGNPRNDGWISRGTEEPSADSRGRRTALSHGSDGAECGKKRAYPASQAPGTRGMCIRCFDRRCQCTLTAPLSHSSFSCSADSIHPPKRGVSRLSADRAVVLRAVIPWLEPQHSIPQKVKASVSTALTCCPKNRIWLHIPSFSTPVEHSSCSISRVGHLMTTFNAHHSL